PWMPCPKVASSRFVLPRLDVSQWLRSTQTRAMENEQHRSFVSRSPILESGFPRSFKATSSIPSLPQRRKVKDPAWDWQPLTPSCANTKDSSRFKAPGAREPNLAFIFLRKKIHRQM